MSDTKELDGTERWSQEQINESAGPRAGVAEDGSPLPEPQAAPAAVERTTIHYADGRMRGGVVTKREEGTVTVVFDDNGQTEAVVLGSPHPCEVV